MPSKKKEIIMMTLLIIYSVGYDRTDRALYRIGHWISQPGADT